MVVAFLWKAKLILGAVRIGISELAPPDPERSGDIKENHKEGRGKSKWTLKSPRAIRQ
jgi:hypothetical protein